MREPCSGSTRWVSVTHLCHDPQTCILHGRRGRPSLASGRACGLRDADVGCENRAAAALAACRSHIFVTTPRPASPASSLHCRQPTPGPVRSIPPEGDGCGFTRAPYTRRVGKIECPSSFRMRTMAVESEGPAWLGSAAAGDGIVAGPPTRRCFRARSGCSSSSPGGRCEAEGLRGVGGSFPDADTRQCH